MSRLSDLLQRSPPATLAILGLNIGVYLVFQLFLDINVNHYTLCPALVFKQPYRLVTSTILHGSIMHIGMNMMSTLGICAALEGPSAMGSTSLLLTTTSSMVVTPSIHVVIAFAMHLIFGFNDWWHQHSLGFSGVLFHLSVLEAAASQNQQRSLFGMISVPSHLYPWALLVLLQVFIPHLSFLGHLSGILAGTAQVGMGYVPHSPTVERWLGRQMDASNFITHNGEQSATLWRNGNNNNNNNNNTSFRHLCGTVVTYVGYALETLKVIIFGRAAQRRSGQSNTEMVSLVGDDDDWMGLPVVAEGDEEDGNTTDDDSTSVNNTAVESQLL